MAMHVMSPLMASCNVACLRPEYINKPWLLIFFSSHTSYTSLIFFYCARFMTANNSRNKVNVMSNVTAAKTSVEMRVIV